MINKHLPGQHNQRAHGRSPNSGSLAGMLDTMLTDKGYPADITPIDENRTHYGESPSWQITFKDTGNVVLLEHFTNDYSPIGGPWSRAVSGWQVGTELNEGQSPDDIMAVLTGLPKLAKQAGRNQLWMDSGNVPLDVVAEVWPKAALQDDGDAPTDAASIMHYVCSYLKRTFNLPDDIAESDEDYEDEAERACDRLKFYKDGYLTAKDAARATYEDRKDLKIVDMWLAAKDDDEEGYNGVITYILDL